jgi:DeoD family purine-nucleoside phosphorylase
VREETIHLRPTAPLAERVVLPGDPGRALLLAQHILSEPRMFNHNRGLWGYTGTASDGEPLTVQSTGMGGPSAAIVIEELVMLGARRLVRAGTCGALDPCLELGDLLVAEQAIGADGTSRTYGESTPLRPDPELAESLRSAAVPGARTGRVVSSDLFYSPDPAQDRESAWAAAGAVAVDMETATLFALATRRGVRAASLLGVSDLIAPGTPRERIGEEALETLGQRLGSVCSAALA